VVGGLQKDDRFLVDYLWNEVVLAQPAAVRQFLRSSCYGRQSWSV
jgi:ATP/maltotriose-dependent transcriptional regulator MalT